MIRAVFNQVRTKGGKARFRVVLADGTHVYLTAREIALFDRKPG